MNVVCDCLQSLKVGDFFDLVTGLLKELLVNDNAVCLKNITDTDGLAFVIFQSEVLAVELFCKVGVGEIIAVILPSCITVRTVDLEDGGSVCFRDFGRKLSLISAASCGQNVNLYAGFIGVSLCESLPCFICFGLE